MDLKTLFKETLPAYYDEVNKKETYVYLSTVNKVLNETKDRIRERKVANHVDGYTEIALGLELALNELAFVSSEITLEQIKTVNDEQ